MTNEMNANSVSKADLKQFEARIDAKIDRAVDDLTAILQGFMQAVDARFNIQDGRFNKIEHEISDLRTSHNRLFDIVYSFIKRIDDSETEQVTRDWQFRRLAIWAHKVAKKAGHTAQRFIAAGCRGS